MRGARYVRLIPWTLQSGSEQFLCRVRIHVRAHNVYILVNLCDNVHAFVLIVALLFIAWSKSPHQILGCGVIHHVEFKKIFNNE
jgi:hypothetical protein